MYSNMRKLILFLPFLFAVVSCKRVNVPIEKYYDKGFVVAEKDPLRESILVKSKDTIIRVDILMYDFGRLKVGNSLKSK